MRVVKSAIWTSGEPVSVSARLYSAISLPLTSVSTAKPKKNYTWPRFEPVLWHPNGRSVRAGIRAGAPGVLLSRKYSEMRLADLSGAGDAIRELKLS